MIDLLLPSLLEFDLISSVWKCDRVISYWGHNRVLWYHILHLTTSALLSLSMNPGWQPPDFCEGNQVGFHVLAGWTAITMAQKHIHSYSLAMTAVKGRQASITEVSHSFVFDIWASRLGKHYWSYNIFLDYSLWCHTYVFGICLSKRLCLISWFEVPPRDRASVLVSHSFLLGQ